MVTNAPDDERDDRASHDPGTEDSGKRTVMLRDRVQSQEKRGWAT